MKLRKVLISSALGLLVGLQTASSQVYYDPSTDIELTIRLIEDKPYTPVNWAQVGTSVSNSIQETMRQREEKRQMLARLSDEVRSSIYANTILTDEPALNNAIQQLQGDAISNVGTLYSLLTSGMLEPAKYERMLQSCYSSFLSMNKNLARLSNSLYRKKEELSEESYATYRERFILTVETISDFAFSEYSVEFRLNQSMYSGYSASHLFNYVLEGAQGNLDTFQNNFKAEEKRRQERARMEREAQQRTVSNCEAEVNRIVRAREVRYRALSESQIRRIQRDEMKILKYRLGYNYKFLVRFAGRDGVSNAELLRLSCDFPATPAIVNAIGQLTR